MMVDVTIAIPTLNRRAQLERAINSCLSQKLDETVEILVSNNMSTDDTKEYLSSLDPQQVKVFHQEKRLSMRDNWEDLLSNASGNLFLLLSDDDWFTTEESLSKLMRPFKQNKELRASISNVNIVQGKRQTVVHPKICGLQNSETLLVNYFNNDLAVYPAASIFYRDDIIEVGGYERCKTTNAIDAEILMKIIPKGQVFYEPEPLLNYTLQFSQTNLPPWVAEQDCDHLIALCTASDVQIADILLDKKKLSVYGFVVRNIRTKTMWPVIKYFIRYPRDLLKIFNLKVMKHLLSRIFY